MREGESRGEGRGREGREEREEKEERGGKEPGKIRKDYFPIEILTILLATL